MFQNEFGVLVNKTIKEFQDENCDEVMLCS